MMMGNWKGTLVNVAGPIVGVRWSVVTGIVVSRSRWVHIDVELTPGSCPSQFLF